MIDKGCAITRNSQQTSAFSAVSVSFYPAFIPAHCSSPRLPIFNCFYCNHQPRVFFLSSTTSVAVEALSGACFQRAVTTLGCFWKRLSLRKRRKDLCAVCIPMADSKVPTQAFHLPLVMLSTESRTRAQPQTAPVLQAKVFQDFQLQPKHILLWFRLYRINNRKPTWKFWKLRIFWLTCIVTILGNGWRVLAPPSMAMPKVLALFITLTSVEVGCSSPG